MDTEKIIHPRPSSIVAAMYTLRDLGADVIILHGPPGCSFKHSRLLEEENIRVLTSSMEENDFVFGGEEKLIETINKGIDKFNPNLIGVVGTCVSMIIGEDLNSAIQKSEAEVKLIAVEVHSGYEDNTTGVIKTLEAAEKSDLIGKEELKRQKHLLNKATEVEKKKGSANEEYITPSEGDLKEKTANRILEKLKNNEKALIILNAKKETSYVFSDILLALNNLSNKFKGKIINLANLSSKKGLPKVKKDARRIKNELNQKDVQLDFITGGLDEYPITGEKIDEIIENKVDSFDFAVILGVPHAVDIQNEKEIISITNGPREVQPLKKLGHDRVILEKDLHTKSMGRESITESKFGKILRNTEKNRSE